MSIKSEQNNFRMPSRLVSRVAAISIGLLLCEVLIRLLVPEPIFYSTWFTRGVHRLDGDLGFVLVPNYTGAMRHVDGVWMEPLQLDRYGFRMAANEPGENDTGASETIVMLGGASMAFSFGLADHEALHWRMADRLVNRPTIRVVSWPGFTVHQDLAKIDRFLDAKRIDRAVVFAYGHEDYEPHREPATPPPSPAVPIDDGIVLPQDPAASLAGRLYYRSTIVAGACRWWFSLAQLIGKDAAKSQTPSPSLDATKNTGKDASVLRVAQRLRDIGMERVFVVALPHQKTRFGPGSLRDWSSEGIEVLDLRDLSDRPEMDWIAGGHYGPRSSAIIGQAIAEVLQSLHEAR
jgi:hypothetical protein